MRTTTIPLVLLLGAGIAPAGARTVIQNEPRQLTPAQQTTVYRTIVRERVAAPSPKPAKASKKDVRRPVAKAGTTIRTTTHERIVTTPAPRQRVAVPVRERAVIAPPDAIVADAPLALTPDQRNVVFRTIVEQPLHPRTVITAPSAPAPILAPPLLPDTRPLVTTEPDTVITTAPAVRQRVITSAPGTTGWAQVSVALEVGEGVPSSIQLYSMPAATVAAVPEMARYHYALVEGRVFLVDPTDGVVVAELYQ